MSYIGATPGYAAFVTDQFSGNGSTTAFTMSVTPAGATSLIVAVSGVLQDPTTYAVAGTTLTFSAAPPTGTGNISVRYLGLPASGVTNTAYRTVTEFTATAGQTVFSIPSYTVGYLNVYQNGVLLGSADYTATTGTGVTLTTGATVGDLITTESFYISSLGTGIPNAGGSVSATNLDIGNTNGTGSVAVPSGTTAQRPTGANGQLRYNSTTNSFEGYADGAWGAIGGGGGGGAGSWQAVQTASFTVVSGNAYPINTTSAAVTVTLPASPAAGDYVQLVDYAGTWGTNNVTISPNGGKIHASTSNTILNVNRESVALVYVDSTQGWVNYGGFINNPVGTYAVEYLVVAAGGGGGNDVGGGGGAGGLLTSTVTFAPGTAYTITVGAGGAYGTGSSAGGSGTNSSISGIATAIGGGGAGSWTSNSGSGNNGLSGGSGGGGAGYTLVTSGGAGTSGQGYAGGNQTLNLSGATGGGGGGAGGAGSNGVNSVGGFVAGGIGVASSISGASVTYSTGGRGASDSWTGISAALANSGNGGDGAGNSIPSAGGSGVVILSYIGSQRGTGGTVTSSGGKTIHTFTTSGTFTA